MNPGGFDIMEIHDPKIIANAYWPSLWEGTERTKAEEAYRDALNGKTSRFQGFCKTGAGTPKWWDVGCWADRRRRSADPISCRSCPRHPGAHPSF
jgi:hypothetical protein